MQVKQKYLITAKDTTYKASQTAKRNFAEVQTSVTSMAAAAVSAAGVAGLGLLVSREIEAADAMLNFSKRTGISTEALSQYEFVAKKTGVSNTTLQTSFQRMTRRVAEAKEGLGEASGALRELGLDATKLAQLKPDQQFEAIADAMSEIENQGDKVRLAMKLFDTEGVALLQTMEGGAAAIRELRMEADDLGLTLSQANAEELSKAKENMDEIKAAASGLARELTVTLGPSITTIIGFISDDLLPSFTEWSSSIGLLDRQLEDLTVNELEARWRRLNDELILAEKNAKNTGLAFASFDKDGKFLSAADASANAIKKLKDEIAEVNKQIDAANDRRNKSTQSPQTEGLRIEKESLEDQKANDAAKREAERDLERQRRAEERASREAEAERLRQERLQAALQARFEATQSALLSEEEAEILAYERRLDFIETQYNEELELQLSQQELLERAAEQHRKRMEEIELKSLTKLELFQRQSYKNQTKQVFGELANMTAGVAQHNRTLFEINKASGIANAIINTYEGVTKTLSKYPQPLAGALAAAHLAAGLAQVQSIKSTSFGSKGSPSSAGLGGGSGTVNTIDVTPETETEDERELNRGTLTIQFVGDVYGLDDFEDRVGKAVQSQTEKDVVLISQGTRQAQELLPNG